MQDNQADGDARVIRGGLIYGLYDWASSPLPTLHATFVFAVYFATVVMPDGGSAAWAWMNAGAALVIAAAAPLLGTIADQRAIRKTLLAIATMIAAIAVALLWFIRPEPALAEIALGLSAVVIIAAELGFVFYNALLPGLTGSASMGRVSGIAWGMGYFGAIACLVFALMVFILPETPPFGLDAEAMEPVRITMPLAAIWFLIFALPFFWLVPERPRSGEPFGVALRDGWQAVLQTPGLLRFLIARMFYTDALITLFAMGGIFAARAHGFSQTDVLVFAIILNITAGIGAVLGGICDDRLGSIRTIRWALVIMMAVGLVAILAQSPMLFWISGSVLGLFVGPLQSSSRSHVGRLAPPHLAARVFGFMMLTGKATAFLGPFLYGLLVVISGSDRLGMAVVIVLMGLGLGLMPRR